MNILMTGGTGFLGSHLLRDLLEDGHDVVVLKRKGSDSSRIVDLMGSFKFFDVNDGLERVFGLSQKFDLVLHCATNYGRENELPSDLVGNNVMFPLGLMASAIEAGCLCFVNIDTALNKEVSSYAMSKSHFADWGKFMAVQKSIRFVNIQLENVFGPDDDITKFPLWLVQRMLNNDAELGLTLGEQVRDFIWIEDAVKAISLVLNFSANDKEWYSLWEVGSGKATTLKEFVLLARSITGTASRINFGAISYRPAEPMYSVANIERLLKLGWRPETDMATGLNKMVKSMNKRFH